MNLNNFFLILLFFVCLGCSDSDESERHKTVQLGAASCYYSENTRGEIAATIKNGDIELLSFIISPADNTPVSVTSHFTYADGSQTVIQVNNKDRISDLENEIIKKLK